MASYVELMNFLDNLKDIETGVIGKSEGNRKIPYVFLGNDKKNSIIITYAIHAREHITSNLAMAHITYLKNKVINGGIYILPMINPDGVELCLKGLKSVNNAFKRNFLFAINGESEDFSLYKANINGVDLNVNFDARWGEGLSNLRYPNIENYIGARPFSEKETKSLKNFTLKVKPKATISYHAKGEVIYWKFYNQKNLERDRTIAEKIKKITGYDLVDEGGSAGGYKDWCVEKLNISAFTIEVGKDELSHPLPLFALKDILGRNLDVPLEVLKERIKL